LLAAEKYPVKLAYLKIFPPIKWTRIKQRKHKDKIANRRNYNRDQKVMP
jgi:hypothetical protein